VITLPGGHSVFILHPYLLLATGSLQLNLAGFLHYLHTHSYQHILSSAPLSQGECLYLKTCKAISILLQLFSLNSSVCSVFVDFITELDSRTMFMQSIGLRQLAVKYPLQFLTIPHLLTTQTLKGDLYIQITFHSKFMIKNFLAHYHLFPPLMMYPWMLTLNHHFLMTMMKMKVMATTIAWIYMIMISMVVMVTAPLPLFQAVHSMNPGHVDINKCLQMIDFSGESIMTNSMVSFYCIFVISNFK
jgi:hypothetical protein